MYNNDEISSYKNLFCNIRITDGTKQKDILEFLYTFGTITYNISRQNSYKDE